MVLHGLKACDSCRKALKTLAVGEIPARLRDLREEPPTQAELVGWLARLGPAMLNTRSTTWRGLTEAERATDPLALMLAHPALIKRPVVETPSGLYLSWTAEAQSAAGLGNSGAG
nr:ArsC/Spx/MgsR family protein [Jannaschia pohangensis]